MQERGGRFVIGGVLLAVSIWIAACTNPAAPRKAIVVRATFSDIQAKVFTPSCTQSSCHNDITPHGELSLEKDTAYGSLVGVPTVPDGNTGLPRSCSIRVMPGHPDTSFLIVKMEGAHLHQPNDGDQMPDKTNALPQSVIDSIRVWILKGAPRN